MDARIKSGHDDSGDAGRPPQTLPSVGKIKVFVGDIFFPVRENVPHRLEKISRAPRALRGNPETAAIIAALFASSPSAAGFVALRADGCGGVDEVRRLTAEGFREAVLTGGRHHRLGAPTFPAVRASGQLVRQVLKHVPALEAPPPSHRSIRSRPMTSCCVAFAEEERLMPHLHLFAAIGATTSS